MGRKKSLLAVAGISLMVSGAMLDSAEMVWAGFGVSITSVALFWHRSRPGNETTLRLTIGG